MFQNGVSESAAQRKENYLERYLVVVIDPVTNNQTDFEFVCTKAWIDNIARVCGGPLSKAMKRLKIRSRLLDGVSTGASHNPADKKNR